MRGVCAFLAFGLFLVVACEFSTARAEWLTVDSSGKIRPMLRHAPAGKIAPAEKCVLAKASKITAPPDVVAEGSVCVDGSCDVQPMSAFTLERFTLENDCETCNCASKSAPVSVVQSAGPVRGFVRAPVRSFVQARPVRRVLSGLGSRLGLRTGLRCCAR